jgi:hypothetical protein
MKKTIFLILIISIGIINFSCRVSQKENENFQAKSDILSTDSLLTLVQYRTFQYFWEGAEPVSGMARERYHVDGIYPQNDKHIVTSGGTGFGIMAILTGIERGFISREEGLNRLIQIVEFLKKADRYHGAWSHWMNGETGKTKPFSPKDDGADLVETAFLMQGLLTAREYFRDGSEKEKHLAHEIDQLWREVEWTWFTKDGEKALYWHWSPKHGWEMNMPVRGWDECLILYVLAASSPTFPINPDVYHEGWARNGDIISNNEKYGLKLHVKHNYATEYGGPLFWSHYSFLGLDPRNLEDKYANYWEVNKNHTLINRQWCIENPKNYKGYGEECWGLTSGYSPVGYAGHAPGLERDLGVITPTAAISSIPYAPEYALDAMEFFYYSLGDKLFGKFGFYDGFSIHHNWFPEKYLAIDQGPMVAMIENYRTGLLWNNFMKNPDIKRGLTNLGFKF